MSHGTEAGRAPETESGPGFFPDPGQALAIAAPAGPLRINAGAGSGKTTVMAHRVKTFVDVGYRPDQILGLTFSNKAAENLRTRIAREVAGGLDVMVTTYHGFGAGIVGDYSLELGFTTPPTLIDKANAFGLLYGALNEITFETRKVGRVAFLVSAAIRLASQCADHLVSLDQVIADCDRIEADSTISPEAVKGARGRRDLARLAKVYADAKRAYNVIDFGDQIGLAVQVLEQHRDRAEEIRLRHPVVLLDEYQDTNYAQRRLLQLIYPPGSPVTVVGDDMQSIYAFRGAHLRNLLDFPEHFGTTPADESRHQTLTHTEATLTTNYRSGPEVVAVANAVAANVAGDTLPKDLRAAAHAPSATIEALVGADDTDEAQKIAAWIADRGEPWSATVVLGRKRKIFPAIAEALTELNVPVEIVGIGGLLLRPEVVDIIAWLEVLTQADPNVAVLRLLRSPLRNIGLNDLALVSRHGSRLARAKSPDVAHPPMSLLDAVDDVDAIAHLSPQAWTRLKAFRADVEFIRARTAELRLAELVELIIDIERLFDRVDDIGSENLLRFLDLAQQFVSLEGSTNVDAFAEYLSLVSDSEDEPAEASATESNAVRIMSIHQAKGLEYNNVVVAGLSGSGASRIFPDDRMAENGVTQSDVLPLWLRTDNDGFVDAPRTKTRVSDFKDHATRQRKDEELRLLYVAVTRARSKLLCTAAQWYPGASKPQGVSDFYELICSLTGLVREHTPRVEAATEDPSIARRRRRVEATLAGDAGLTGNAAAARSPSKNARRSKVSADQSSLLAGFGAEEGDSADMTTSLGRTDFGFGSFSVSALASLQRCPRQFEWSTVHRLPRPHRFSGSSGVSIHASIQEHFDAVPMATREPIDDRANFDPDFPERDFLDTDVATSDDSVPDDSARVGLAPGDHVTHVVHSRWGSATVLGTEVPFALPISLEPEGRPITVRGRIDAVFELEGRTHIVDWKTGRTPADGDPAAQTQLDIYGLVASELWGIDPQSLATSYVYTRFDPIQEHTTLWGAAKVDAASRSLRKLVATASGPSFPTNAGPWCSSCDFEFVCPGSTRRIDDRGSI
jgi:DNA helicase II / ATP-dependent DNA helicase PcrA